MDYHERQAAGARGRIRRDCDDYLDLGRMLVILLPSAFAVVWGLWYASEIGIFIYSVLVVVFGIALQAVITFHRSGRLEVVSEKWIPMREVQARLEELGYQAESGDEYYTRFVRKLSRLGPSIRIEIFTYEEHLLGHGWMTAGYPWNRMPFFTGKSQIRAIRDRLSPNFPAAPTNSSAEMGTPEYADPSETK